jgi:UDP-galactose transporter B1
MRSSASPTAQCMMKAVNGWSSIFMTIAAAVSGEFVFFFDFALKYPKIIVQLLSFGFASALGQLFIFYLISNFGSLSNSIVTTSRKFFTVLISLFLFGNRLTMQQWVGTILVFSGLFADMFYGKKDRENDKLKSNIDEIPNKSSGTYTEKII